ncbi:MAG: disulfide oxidoreductase, partial [Pseudomonadota bacterium]|nr:disulfide oxidoreductase [Pseudomonadota bacterium]
VDDIAADDARQKVERRLTHWINRRIAALFEPLTKMRDDEALVGLAKGVGYRLVETLGVIPRPEVAKDVKELDQEGRGLLRKHGVRFGQHTVFMPALLKPAPTRLRIALWALWEGLEDYPSPPPPGLVTIPAVEGMPAGFWPRAGYRLAGERAIRIDMLERLADLLRAQDQRAGFEATADMLSITGCTLDQFADLMAGLGFKAEKGERPKPAPGAKDAAGDAAGGSADVAAQAAAPTEAPGDEAAPAAAPTDAGSVEAEAVEPASDAAETPEAVQAAAPDATAEPAAETAEADAAPAETPDATQAETPAPVADAAASETTDPAAAPAEPAAPAEMQVFYT